MTNNINGIDLSKYFKNHYDSWGRLYCIEYKGNPLELQNAIKRLQEENEGLKSLNDFNVQKIEVLQEENEELKIYIQKMDKPEIKTIDSEIALKNIELQQENEKIKKQYNCYACGNCNGKEDYINLEKHHKGLRKQFDELVKRNNTLSLRIEELENEKEKSKEYFLEGENNLKLY